MRGQPQLIRSPSELNTVFGKSHAHSNRHLSIIDMWHMKSQAKQSETPQTEPTAAAASAVRGPISMVGPMDERGPDIGFVDVKLILSYTDMTKQIHGAS